MITCKLFILHGPSTISSTFQVSLLQNKSIVVSPDQTIETDMTAEISVIESLASLSEVDTTHTVMTVGGHGPATEIEIDTSGNIVQETIEEVCIILCRSICIKDDDN